MNLTIVGISWTYSPPQQTHNKLFPQFLMLGLAFFLFLVGCCVELCVKSTDRWYWSHPVSFGETKRDRDVWIGTTRASPARAHL